jgi:hypothetical protein
MPVSVTGVGQLQKAQEENYYNINLGTYWVIKPLELTGNGSCRRALT